MKAANTQTLNRVNKMLHRFFLVEKYQVFKLAFRRHGLVFRDDDLIDERICSYDTSRVIATDFGENKLRLCANLVPSQVALERHVVGELVRLYDYHANGRVAPDCAQFLCTTIRGLNISGACSSSFTRQRLLPQPSTYRSRAFWRVRR